jgi:hypothetical protein
MKNIKQYRGNFSFKPVYVFFYLILLEDTWRIVFGIIFAYFIAPSVLATRQIQSIGTIFIYLMLISIGWWIFAIPAKKITRFLMTWIHKKHTQPKKAKY